VLLDVSRQAASVTALRRQAARHIKGSGPHGVPPGGSVFSGLIIHIVAGSGHVGESLRLADNDPKRSC